MVLEPFQSVGVRHLASNFHAALGDERGLGKTVQAIYAAEKVNARTVLVTCPASVRTNWLEHVKNHFGDTAGWDIVSYDAAFRPDHRLKLRNEYDVWIGDELHFCKGLSSRRTQAILGREGLARRAIYKWPLSGTFAPNHRPIELFPMLKTLAPGFRDVSYSEYTKQYCSAFFDGRGWNVKGASRLAEWKSRIGTFLLRRTKKEVYPNRKAPLVSFVPVSLSRQDLAEVTALEDAIGGREARLSSQYEDFSQLGDMSALLRLLGLAMVPHICRFVADLLETENKVVIFAHHVEVISRLLDHFRSSVAYLGGMTGAQKKMAIDLFRQPDRRVFIGQRQAAGTGINGLQEVCSTVVIAEPSWTPGETEQLIGRLDRMGQNAELVTAYVLYAQGTLSAAVVGVHERKEKTGRNM